MANLEHLEILNQKVETWNRWRKDNPSIKPDLSGADLGGAYLTGADLSEADLSGAMLGGATLSEADLRWAKLGGADLGRADLKGANLYGSDLSGAKFGGARLGEAKFGGVNLNGVDLSGVDLSGAGLDRAKLSKADLSGAKLDKADLSEADLSWANLLKANLLKANLLRANLLRANLREANLIGADLSWANLRSANLLGANLNEADLIGAKLGRANLIGADLSEANLSWTDLSEADLRGANLEAARLIGVRLDRATLTGALLWETQRSEWSIKSVACEWVQWEKSNFGLDRSKQTLYAPGEFERLFADKTKIRLSYKDGINPLEIATLPALIKHLEAFHPGCSLRLDSIHDAAGGAVVELVIEDTGDRSPEQIKQLKAALEAEAQRTVEYQRQALAERETRLQLEGALRQSDAIIDKLILRPTTHHGDLNMRDKYEISGQAGAVGPNAHAHDNTFNQIANRLEQSVDLATLAQELSELRQAITAKQDSSPQTLIAGGEIARAEIAAREKNGPKVVEHLKAAGQWALDFAKEVGKDVAAEAIKKSLGMS